MNKNIVIRHETIADYKTVEILVRDCFWNLYFPGCHEHFVVHCMRYHKDFLPELSFILQKDDEIIGAIFYTKSHISCEDGSTHDTITFGPVCIAPNYQRQGYGRILIEHSIEHAKKLGYSAILTLGYPYHYAPYGFKGGKTYNISMPDGKYYKGLLVLPLFENALENISGIARFSKAFDIQAIQVDYFDQYFPQKVKITLPSQAKYEKACAELDND